MLCSNEPPYRRSRGTDDSYADLDYGQETMGIFSLLFQDLGPLVARSNELGNPAFPDGNYGKLGTGKKTVNDDKNENDKQLQ